MMQNLLEYIKKTKSSDYVDIYDPESLENYITRHGAKYIECSHNYYGFLDYCRIHKDTSLKYTKGSYSEAHITHWFMIEDGHRNTLFIRTTITGNETSFRLERPGHSDLILTPEQCVNELEKMLKR